MISVRTISYCLVVSAAAATPALATLPLTGFEPSEGYSPTGGVLFNGTVVTGTVVGQPSASATTWGTVPGDSRHAFVVRPGVGYNGSQGLLSQQLLGNALWNPTPGVLDGVATQFVFGFKFRFVDPPFRNGEVWDGFFGFRIDDTNGNGSHFEVYLNAGEGYVRATGRDNAGNQINQPLVNSANQPFRAEHDVWYEVYGDGDYVTDTYNVYVRRAGVANAEVFRRLNMPFRYHGLGFGQITPGPRTQDDDIVRLFQAKIDPQLYRQIALDDVYYTVIPEPGALAWLGLPALALVRRRRH
ncbi:MAG: hypothetical protein ACK4PI_11610 [Tepidisphaerales bacterium]